MHACGSLRSMYAHAQTNLNCLCVPKRAKTRRSTPVCLYARTQFCMRINICLYIRAHAFSAMQRDVIQGRDVVHGMA